MLISPMPLGVFNHRSLPPAVVLLAALAENQELASILLCGTAIPTSQQPQANLIGTIRPQERLNHLSFCPTISGRD